MGKAKKLRSLEYQEKKLQKDIKDVFDEMMNNINKRKKKDERKDNVPKNKN